MNQGRTITQDGDNEAAAYQCDSVNFADRIGESILFRLPMSTKPRSICLQILISRLRRRSTLKPPKSAATHSTMAA